MSALIFLYCEMTTITSWSIVNLKAHHIECHYHSWFEIDDYNECDDWFRSFKLIFFILFCFNTSMLLLLLFLYFVRLFSQWHCLYKCKVKCSYESHQKVQLCQLNYKSIVWILLSLSWVFITFALISHIIPFSNWNWWWSKCSLTKPSIWSKSIDKHSNK